MRMEHTKLPIRFSTNYRLEMILEGLNIQSVHLKHLVSSIDIQHLQGEFNTDLDKPMSRSDFRDWVVDNFNNYEMLKSILEHKKTAIDELNVIASLMVVIVIIIVWLLFMGFLTTKVLVFISSQILLIAFVFGNSAKNVFEAVIFVFVVHLFDVGDRCIIDGTTMTVDEMTIMTTKFKRDDDGELICYPNAVLATTPIKMLYKIPQKSDCLEFGIDVSTPQSAFERLQHRIKRYLQENPRRWQPEHSIQVMAIDDNKMTVALHVNHTINYRHRKKRAKRRSDLLLEMRHIFQDLGIQYNLPRQRVHLFFEGGNALTPLSVFQ
ncbi:hypothetical protein GH714_038527 [Hevea brasiliensis]|uniref:Mechanosensitive ion channel MscS domain-containing protein n=1 Tax=Hevea brasiliensis TaxID=3981 RepID=A0A6A6KFF2_HEVBR|nr:hypothetical protein GH714_038527 [Hevea brasiliensis]